MISIGKLPAAYYALNGVLVRARTLAEHEGACDQLRRILDYAEDLVRLVANDADETDRFREVLVEIAERFQCAFVVQRFDEVQPKRW